VTVAAAIDEAGLRETALADPRIRELLDGKQIRKVIIVPGKLVNIVVAA
jgi:leucyl-tRNA synthetase